MKKLLPFVLIIFYSSISFAQIDDRPENTGGNFSLEGALELFKKAKSVEEFETLLNDEANNVNNIDLNNDQKTDYISVEDIANNDIHVLVLSTYLNDIDKQDIATINIEKTGSNQATIQIVGDPDLYPQNTIVEPFATAETMQNSKGPNAPKIVFTQIMENVWFWPTIQFMYAPRYVVWRSPFRWARYPRWYRPWRPFGYQNFYNRCAHYRVVYRRTPNYRVVNARNMYAPRRRTSTLIMHNRRGTTVIYNNQRPRSKGKNYGKNRMQNHSGRGYGRR
ncbi:MAG: hypothetical protein H7221_03675 [Flavobacterium sp.]|nr:hypothetical protein [Flavobacterium sp.]